MWKNILPTNWLKSLLETEKLEYAKTLKAKSSSVQQLVENEYFIIRPKLGKLARYDNSLVNTWSFKWCSEWTITWLNRSVMQSDFADKAWGEGPSQRARWAIRKWDFLENPFCGFFIRSTGPIPVYCFYKGKKNLEPSLIRYDVENRLYLETNRLSMGMLS